MLLCCDLDTIDGPGELEKLGKSYVQLGIDIHFINKGVVVADSSSCRLPTLVAGKLLQNAEMLNIVGNWTRTDGYDRMSWMCYYIEDGQSTITSSVVPEGSVHTGYVLSSDKSLTGLEKVIAWRQSIGNYEHEHLDPDTEWDLLAGGGGTVREAYRQINSPGFVGIVLAGHLFDLVDEWGDTESFDYVYRWMDETLGSGYATSASTFIDLIWDLYNWVDDG